MEPVVGVIIKIPPEAVIPLAIGVAALVMLLFFGSKLAEWKARSPGAASQFALIAATVLTAAALYFLLRCVTNQNDPNNDLPGNINFTDAPIAGFLAAIGTAFWRMADQRAVTLVAGLGIGAVMIAKSFIWPVISIGPTWNKSRDLIDPEHIMFWGPGVVVVVVALIAGAKPKR